MARNKRAENADYSTPTPSEVGLRGCCPHCGDGRLFVGLLAPASTCPKCGLSFEFIDSGDGPAVFVILLVGFVVTAFAMALQSAVNPPIWVHMMVWIPVVAVLSVWGLRFSKGVMIALQYRTGAKQGELTQDE